MYKYYSIGGWSIKGRGIGQDGIDTLEHARELGKDLASQSFCASLSIFGWKDTEEEKFHGPDELEVIK